MVDLYLEKWLSASACYSQKYLAFVSKLLPLLEGAWGGGWKAF